MTERNVNPVLILDQGKVDDTAASSKEVDVFLTSQKKKF